MEGYLFLKGSIMRIKKYWILVLAIISCTTFLSVKLFATSIEEKAQIDTYGFSTLRNLEGIYRPGVVVLSRTVENLAETLIEGKENELDEACRSIREDLRNEVSLLLQNSGIKIFPVTKNDLQSADVGRLGIEVTLRKPVKDVQLYAFTVQIELQQEVQLVRDSKIKTYVSTWPNSVSRPDIVFVSGFTETIQAIRNEVIKQTKKFIEDYLAANSEKQAAGMNKKAK
jgi:vacuolar-type H+-ATPase subunit H